MTPPALVIQVLLVLLVLAAAVFDLRYRRIPNWLVLAGLLAGLAGNALLAGWSGLRLAGLGIGLAFLIYIPLYAIRAMGAGDAKLMAAVGALAGPGPWLLIFFATALVGGLLAIVFVVSKGRVRTTLSNVVFMLQELASFRPPYARNPELDVRDPRAARLPHSVSVAVGCIIVLLSVHLYRG
jgi:prepilin peptidase CpaA